MKLSFPECRSIADEGMYSYKEAQASKTCTTDSTNALPFMSVPVLAIAPARNTAAEDARKMNARLLISLERGSPLKDDTGDPTDYGTLPFEDYTGERI